MLRHFIAGLILSIPYFILLMVAGWIISLALLIVYLVYCCMNWWAFLFLPVLAILLFISPIAISIVALVVFLGACLFIKD